MAASIAGLLWQLVRLIRECRRGAAVASGRLPRNNGGIAANPKTSDRLFVVGLDDIKFSEELHLRGRRAGRGGVRVGGPPPLAPVPIPPHLVRHVFRAKLCLVLVLAPALCKTLAPSFEGSRA